MKEEMKKYEHSFNPYPNNISCGGKTTNQLDLLMEIHFNQFDKDFYVLERHHIRGSYADHIHGDYLGGLDELRKYVVGMQHLVEESLEGIDYEEQSSREQMITKGFYYLLALYDVMNRVALTDKVVMEQEVINHL